MAENPPQTHASPPVIEMNGVSAGSVQDLANITLEDVNWTVMSGEFWVIAGMHGSGKTDLMWMTAGIMPPQTGTYKLFGNDMPIYTEEGVRERLRVGLAFENGQLIHHLTVKENIALPLRYHRDLPWPEVEAQVNAMLEKTELTPFADITPATLGHNWQKRTGLARALMLDPELLLVDHPLGGLDLRHANWWLRFLKEWHAQAAPERPRTVAVTVEDLRPWKDLDSHFALLQKKRFVPLGRRPKFVGHHEPLVKELLAEDLLRAD